jgi:hypothetical protein
VLLSLYGCVAIVVFVAYNALQRGVVVVAPSNWRRKVTTDENLAEKHRLEIARHIYDAMCSIQYADRLITLVDSHGRQIARSDRPCVPPAEANKLS